MHKRGQDETDLEVEIEGNSAAIVKHKTQGTTKLCNFQFFKLFHLVPFVNAGISGRQNLVSAPNMDFLLFNLAARLNTQESLADIGDDTDGMELVSLFSEYYFLFLNAGVSGT